MTENEWLKGHPHAQGMLWYLRKAGKVTRTKVGRRKLRLFACGCCRLVWEQMQDSRLRDAVEVAERFAEGQANKAELEAAHNRISELGMGCLQMDAPGVHERTAAGMVRETTKAKAFSGAFMVTAYPVPLAGCVDKVRGEALLCELIRCVFGNPFRTPPAIDRDWLKWNNGTIRTLATAIYEERRFEDMGVLADALSDAGCDSEEILGHSRQQGTSHCRGCWVVDSLLGKQ